MGRRLSGTPARERGATTRCLPLHTAHRESCGLKPRDRQQNHISVRNSGPTLLDGLWPALTSARAVAISRPASIMTTRLAFFSVLSGQRLGVRFSGPMSNRLHGKDAVYSCSGGGNERKYLCTV